MRIVVLCTQKHLYSNQRLQQSALSRGHQLDFLDIRHGGLSLSGKENSIFTSQPYDAVIARYSLSWAVYGNLILKHFEDLSAYALNTLPTLLLSRNKAFTLQHLNANGLATPKSIVAFTHERLPEALTQLGSPPYILKLPEGARGIGVMLAQTQSSALSILQSLKTLTPLVIIQEYIAEAAHSDIRCFVLDHQIIAAIERQAAPEEFRANLHRGAEARVVELTEAEKNLAIATTRAFNLSCAGIDLIRSKNGPLVIDVNAVPGFEGCERTCQVDIAAAIIELLEHQIAQPS